MQRANVEFFRPCKIFPCLLLFFEMSSLLAFLVVGLASLWILRQLVRRPAIPKGLQELPGPKVMELRTLFAY